MNQQNLHDEPGNPYAEQHCYTWEVNNRTAIELMVVLIQFCRLSSNLTWYAIDLYKTIVEKWPGVREIIMSKEEMTVQELHDRLKKITGLES